MVHWQTIKKIQEDIKYYEDNPKQDVELSKKTMEKIEKFVKRKYKPLPAGQSNSSADMASKGVKSTAHYSAFDDSLEDRIRQMQKSKNAFIPFLMLKLKERKITVSQLCHTASLHPSMIGRIEQDNEANQWKPDKDTILKMGMAMRMKEKDMNKLLNIAGYALTVHDDKDCVIICCMKEKIYNRLEINYAVFKITKENLYK